MNEWMNYTVNVTTSGSYSLKVRAAGNGGNISVSVDGHQQRGDFGYRWMGCMAITLGNVSLSAGKHTIRVTASTAGYNLSYFDFSMVSSFDVATSAADQMESSEATLNNFPNPFNGSTAVQIVVVEDGDVSVKVYDKTGFEVKSLTDGFLQAGTYNVVFDASELKSDLYLIKFNANNKVYTRKVMKVE